MFNEEIEGIRDSIGEIANIQAEYMDFKKFDSEQNEINFYNLLKYKINKYDKYDIVIVSEEPALNFVKKYRDDLFKDIPIVFFGVHDMTYINEAINLDLVYGIGEDISIQDNIELISKNHKNNRIVAITYETAKESKELEKFYSLQKKYKNIKFEHLSLVDTSQNEFEDSIKN